jgi:predicted alpha/beta-fold hydrolase
MKGIAAPVDAHHLDVEGLLEFDAGLVVFFFGYHGRAAFYAAVSSASHLANAVAISIGNALMYA